MSGLGWLLAAAAVSFGATGCSTAQMATPASAEALEEIPIGTRVRVVTRDGQRLRLKVTATAEDSLSGRDRYFRRHELARTEIAEIDAPPQNDWWVALFWVGIVFVART